MTTLYVQLASIADVKHFVNTACLQPFDIDLVSGRYIIDAKSIMGIFSLDLSKPIRMEIHGTDADAKAFCETMANYITENPEEA